MKRLIMSELNKLWKGRKLWIGILLIIGFSFNLCSQTYYSQEDIYRGYDMKNEQGEIVSPIDLIRARDQIMHHYAGEWSEEKENIILKDLKGKLSQYPRNQLDDEAMQKEYGQNYAQYLAKEEMIGLTEQDIEDISNEIGKTPQYKEIDNHITLDRIYTNDPYRQYLSYIYTGNITYHENFESDVFGEWNHYLLSPTLERVTEENWEYDHIVKYQNLTTKQQHIYQDYLMQQVKDLPKTYDSGLPNQYILNAISQSFILPLFIIIILLTSTFSIENELKTDQIIYPTQATQHKITVAKLISGYISTIGIILLPILIIYLFFMIVFPVHDWNILVTFLDFMSTDLIIPATYLDLLVNGILLGVMSAIAVATMTMFLSYLTKRKFIVVIIMFIFMGVGLLTSMLNISEDWYYIFCSSHPFNMAFYPVYFSLQGAFMLGMPIYLGTPYIFTETMIIPFHWLAIGGWTVLTLIILLWLFFKSKKTLLYNQKVRY